MGQHASGQQGGAVKASWLDRAVDILKPQPGAPPKPAAPAVHEGEWHKSVERKEVVQGLTVHDVGLSVFGETRSLSDRPGSNEPIGTARQKVAHAMINGAEEAHRRGQKPPSVHAPIEPRDLRNSKDRAAYESSMKAAREAYLNGHDPTHGATYFNMRPTPDRSNLRFQHGKPEGVPISTQSGPYYNSFLKKDVPSHTAWVNTYHSEHEKKD